MIERPRNLIICEVELWFNSDFFSGFEFDIEHINLGKNGTRNSNYFEWQIVEIAFELINGEFLYPESRREYKEEFCDYFVKIGKFKNQKFKIVFCICSDRPRSIGVLTLFRQ